MGGKKQTLVKTSPRLNTELLRILDKNAKKANTYHTVCFEVTHHGPYLEVPTLFIEVGSNEEEWNNKKPAEIVAETLIELFKKYHYEEDLPKDIPVLIGIGGGHYAPRFTDVALEKKAAFGHMIPTYQIENGNINTEMLQKAIDATPNFKGIYIHRKGLKKSQITMIKQWCKELDISYISSKDLEDL